MADTGYNLNTLHRVRCFPPHENLHKLLKGVRQFVKDNDVRVETINISSRYDEETKEIVFEGFAIYLGVSY